MVTQIPASLKPGRCAGCRRLCVWRWESPGTGWRDQWAKWEELGEAGKDKHFALLDSYVEKQKSHRLNEVTPEEQKAAFDVIERSLSAKARLQGEWVCKGCFSSIVGVQK